MGITCVVSAGVTLLAPGLLTACSLEDSHDVSLFTQGMAMTNVDVRLSPGSKHCNGTTAAVSFGWCGVAATGFSSASARSFSLSLHSAFTWPVFWQWKHLLRKSFFAFFDDSFLASLPLPLLLTSLRLPLPLLSLPLALALRIRSELHWQWLTVDVPLCSRDLENLLSHLAPACDPDAVPDEVLFASHVLHPQHRHSYLDVVVFGLS